jgi:hypothetical protein
MKRLAFLLALPMTACATPQGDTRLITWVRSADRCQELPKSLWKPDGCADYRSSPCYVFAPEPTPETERKVHEVMGHEMRHCFEGRFHE